MDLLYYIGMTIAGCKVIKVFFGVAKYQDYAVLVRMKELLDRCRMDCAQKDDAQDNLQVFANEFPEHEDTIEDIAVLLAGREIKEVGDIKFVFPRGYMLQIDATRRRKK